MDIKRSPKSKLKKRIRTVALLLLGVVALGGITYGLTKLRPAPTIHRSTTVIDAVSAVRCSSRFTATLAAHDVHLIPAPADRRIEKVLNQACIEVKADTVVVEHSNRKWNHRRSTQIYN